jgi:hypothetical protein
MFHANLKGQCHEIDIFFGGLNILGSILSVYALMVFKVFQKIFNALHKKIYFLFASLKLLTNFETAYCTYLLL